MINWLRNLISGNARKVKIDDIKITLYKDRQYIFLLNAPMAYKGGIDSIMKNFEFYRISASISLIDNINSDYIYKILEVRSENCK